MSELRREKHAYREEHQHTCTQAAAVCLLLSLVNTQVLYVDAMQLIPDCQCLHEQNIPLEER